MLSRIKPVNFHIHLKFVSLFFLIYYVRRLFKIKGLTIGIPDFGRNWYMDEKRTFFKKKMFIVQCDELWSDKVGVGFIRVKAEALKEKFSRRRARARTTGEKEASSSLHVFSSRAM